MSTTPHPTPIVLGFWSSNRATKGMGSSRGLRRYRKTQNENILLSLFGFFKRLNSLKYAIYPVYWPILLKFCEHPIEQCLNLAAKNICVVSWLRICQLFTVLTGVIFQVSELLDPGMETISTRAQLKEHLILCHFRFSNHHCNWQILIKVWSNVIILSTTLEYEKVRQIWALLYGKFEIEGSLSQALAKGHTPDLVVYFLRQRRRGRE